MRRPHLRPVGSGSLGSAAIVYEQAKISVTLTQVLGALHCLGWLSGNERQDKGGLGVVTIG